jgi:uncharacterized protein (TIGR01655 family)
MKRKHIFLFCVIAAIVIAGLISFVAASKAPRWGRTQYYTKVTTSTPADNGQGIWQYEYRLPSYTADGSVRQLDFTAPKILRRDAYLRVYARSDGSVTAWEEVKPADVPDKAREQLH